MGVPLTEKHSPDIGVGSIGRWPECPVLLVFGVGIEYASDAHIRHGQDTILASSAPAYLECSLSKGLVLRGASGGTRPVTPRV